MIFSTELTFKTAISSLHIPFNPLNLNSDQHKFSPNNIHALPKEMVMGIIKMIT